MNENIEKELTVITPEHVELQFQTAGIGSRAIAQLIDVVILIVVISLFGLAIVLVSSMGWKELIPGLADYMLAAVFIIIILIIVGYFIASEMYMGGQTPGKRMLGLRVLQENGQSATFLSIIIRNLFRLLDLLPMLYFLGAVFILFSSKDRRIGDMVAGTIVVVELQQERKKRKKNIHKSLKDWQNKLPVLEMDEEIRRAVTLEDWQLLNAWIDRLPGMSRARREELSVPIAQHFAVKLGYSATHAQDSSAYLVALYQELRKDWEI